MLRRVALMVLLMVGTLVCALRVQAQEMRPAVDRPEIMEVGDPILINRRVLAQEMTRNMDLRDWVYLYGVPDYAEVQEIQIDPPWAAYEVRLYYLKRNAYLAFGRAHVSPSLWNYGARKYFGPINPSEVERLLTAQPAAAGGYSMPQTGMETTPPVTTMIETVPVEGVPVSN